MHVCCSDVVNQETRFCVDFFYGGEATSWRTLHQDCKMQTFKRGSASGADVENDTSMCCYIHQFVLVCISFGNWNTLLWIFFVDISVLPAALTAAALIATPWMACAHKRPVDVPCWMVLDINDSLTSQHSFWEVINTYVKKRDFMTCEHFLALSIGFLFTYKIRSRLYRSFGLYYELQPHVFHGDKNMYFTLSKSCSSTLSYRI